MSRITLLTDFGTRDGYVGAMKGVIASIAPDAIVDDVSHDIPAGDVEAAAWALGAYWRRYPPGTVHLVVVDPGVGTSRRAVVAEADERILVGPDNGVLGWVLRDAWRTGEVRELATPSSSHIAPTFHGRDIFAPAAARLAAGAPLVSMGPPALGLVRLPWPEPVRGIGTVEGEIVHVDRYGNLVTNLRANVAPKHVHIGDTEVPVHTTYGDVASGEPVAYVGSRGLLEIAVRDGNAADRFGGKGTSVVARV